MSSAPKSIDDATVIIQARMGSTRLPGKSMALLGSHPVIDWVTTRALMAASVSTVIVATSTNPEDDVLAEHIEQRANPSIRVVRGSASDVLARFVLALDEVDSDYVVRVTGDCPFVQPTLIDSALETAAGIEYVATDPDGRFPRGFDVEAVHRSALLTADAEAVDPLEREHVTPFIVRRPERFASAPLLCPEWARHPELRITLDEQADLDLLHAVVSELGATPETLEGLAVLELLVSRPDLVAINRSVHHNIVK